jgi:hypothetical protein
MTTTTETTDLLEDSNYVKDLLIRDKGFLKKLYDSENNVYKKRILLHADDKLLDSLLCYIHYVANAKIKIKQPHFQAIVKEHKLTLIRNKTEKTKSFKKLIEGPRTVKILFLRKLIPIYKPLLYVLFNEI